MATLTDKLVDLLIVGAGPAGLMLALWASKFNMKTRIVDDKDSRVATGRADGVNSRTLEIFQSFGIARDFISRAYHINEICKWNPKPSNEEEIERTETVLAQPHHLSRFTQSSLNQGAIEQILEDEIISGGRIRIERNTKPISLHLDETEACSDGQEANQVSYPIHVTLRKIEGKQSASTIHKGPAVLIDEKVKAKYVVGCDGAHSWVRRAVNMTTEGQKTDTHFGVIDIVPLTDFPDIRKSCVIHSKYGSVMTVPREDRLVRLYVQLGETARGSNLVKQADVTPEMILEHAQRILKPYTLNFEICDWHSVYTVGQRLAPRFDYKNRIFLAGDAVHTHSPTLGQGMNVSMQDAFNLGWKLGSVITGVMKPEILSTYNDERRLVAVTLIDLDKEMTRFYSKGPSKQSRDYQTFRDRFAGFVSGTAVCYAPSALVAKTSEQSSVSHIELGQRLPSHKVVCNAEANLIHLSDMMPSNGTWRILTFAGDIESPSQLERVQQLGTYLEGLKEQYSYPEQATLEVLLVHSGTRDFNVLDLHPVYHPWSVTHGWDYWKVFSDDVWSFEPCQSPYEKYGVDKQRGCVVIVRPDQHVSYIGALDNFDNISQFFSGALLQKLGTLHLN
ncbi:FAD binding domain-containing protein [Hypoxylon sp. FL1150]|nr:FAD binding domain-containing protein [Hypoxylon sp. FL1150]